VTALPPRSQQIPSKDFGSKISRFGGIIYQTKNQKSFTKEIWRNKQ
jgi:hypothetical protein